MNKNGTAMVSVLIPTYNRREYLPVALASAVGQDYEKIEILVIRDGGEDISDIVNSFSDERIVFLNRDENRGIPYTLNEGLTRAKGKYICYLGDDDLYYPHHVSTLVNALENQTDCLAAYSDLYRTYCRTGIDGEREVLSKVVEISRDYDRFLMLHFNHVLHVSLMHRRDLIEKTGLYNENLNVLIDWDLNRRMSFFTDFLHVHEITGEFYSPIGGGDRVSIRARRNERDFLKNIMAIRTTRPAKPWTRIKDLAIILIAEALTEEVRQSLISIWQHTFYPYEVYLPLPAEELSKLDAEMPNINCIPVEAALSDTQKIDVVLEKTDAEYIAIIPAGMPIKDFGIEDSLYALINCTEEELGFELENSTDEHRGLLLNRGDMEFARKGFSELSVNDSLRSAGISIRRILPQEIPFQFDQLLHEAMSAAKEGNFAEAAEILEHMSGHYQNELWTKSLAANALYQAGKHGRAMEMAHQINRRRPTVDTLLLEAKINHKNNNVSSAIGLLEQAEQILEGNQLQWT
jgi:glycosyltransferase involved in cell wall biosynthesis